MSELNANENPVLRFPDNAVTVLRDRFMAIQGIDSVVKRPLKLIDPSESIGVFATEWRPVVHEVTQREPALMRYQVQIDSLVKHSDEAEGRSLHTGIAKLLRVILYRDEELRISLTALNETLLGVVERAQRFGIESQDFLSGETGGGFAFMSRTSLWLETEIG